MKLMMMMMMVTVRYVQAVLSDALGVKGQVRKDRRLFLIGQTRVHLDIVEGLGHYMELEVSALTGLFLYPCGDRELIPIHF